MNASQIKYAMGRVDEIERSLLNAVKQEDYKTKGVKFSPEKRATMLLSGKAKVREDRIDRLACGYRSVNADDFVFPGEKPEVFDFDGFDRARNVIKAEATRIRDGLMLGDAQEALAAFENFGKKGTKK